MLEAKGKVEIVPGLSKRVQLIAISDILSNLSWRARGWPQVIC